MAVGSAYRRLAPAILALVFVALAPAATVRAGVEVFTFGVGINSYYMYGYGPASTPLTVSLYAPSGALADRARVTTNASGSYSVVWDSPVIVGSFVQAVTGMTSRTFKVPRLSVKALRGPDLLTGKAPAGTTLSIQFTHWPTLNYASTVYFSTTATADGSGNWSKDVTSQVNLTGYDTVYVYFSTATNDSVSVGGQVPYMLAKRSSSELQVGLNNGTSATFELRSAANALRGTASAAWSPTCCSLRAAFVDSLGDAVDVRATNKVIGSFAGDAVITIPAITITANASTDQATGFCMPNAPYSLLIRRPDYSASLFRYGAANGSGNLSVGLAGWNVQLNDKLYLTCRYPTGDQVQAYGVV